MPGTYEISPTKLADLPDAPFVLRQGKENATIGGTGIDSARLDVSYQGNQGRFKQVLTIQSYSYLNHVDLKFERTVRTNFTIGQPNNYSVGSWEFSPINVIGSWNIFPLIQTTTSLLLPGLKKFISTGLLSSYFVNDGFTPANSGVLETLPITILPEFGGRTTRVIQRYTEYGDEIRIYERTLVVNTENVGNTFPAGIGGGYPGYQTVRPWKELTNN